MLLALALLRTKVNPYFSYHPDKLSARVILANR